MKAATKTLFLSTPSARRATGAARAAERSRQYFYPRPPRGGRPQRTAGRKQRGDFYPRPPRGGRREGKLTAYTRGEFLSTPSARRATSIRSMCCSPGAYFYPRPPRGGRPPVGTRKAACHELFLSTPSARRTTVSVSPEAAVLPNFYPRPPRGGRQYLYRSYHTLGGFLSTPSARRATLKTTITTNVGGISIHALREEGDRRAFLQGRLPVYFYPRPPRGGRPILRSAVLAAKGISIHALHEEGDS